MKATSRLTHLLNSLQLAFTKPRDSEPEICASVSESRDEKKKD
jgi:hypothetical protein